MLLLGKPDEANIRSFLSRQQETSFSYAMVGASERSQAPRGYTIDHNRIHLGFGREVYFRAQAAVREWRMFDLGWVNLCFPDTPIEEGQTVAILIKHFGFWSLNTARIVYTLSEENSAIERFGFAYGTLEEHAEKGEERFSVEYHQADQSVWYDLYAFSRPKTIWAKAGYPASRYLQKRFAADSKQAMQRAVNRSNR